MAQTVTAHWLQDYTFVGKTDSHKSVIMDAPTVKDGEKCAPSPMEMVLLGLMGCAGIDVKLILSKSKKEITKLEIKATANRRDEFPRIFTDIHLHFIVSGEDLDEKSVSRAIKLSAEKYCSVSAMLEKTVEITHDFEIV
ncbi:MAG: OsmC family protein [Gammaproteobacteria bacterium]|jgi:putative redox protein|nr:OsmC family protein [Xanthomonadales bacterium]